MRDFTLVIDPGHGLTDSGAVGNGIIEKNKVLQMGLAAKYALSKEFKVELTRSLDVKRTFNQRAEVARNASADLVISLHINAAVNLNARGLWIFHQHDNAWSKQLAKFAASQAPTYFQQYPIRMWDAKNDPKALGDEWLQRPENVLKSYSTTALLLEWGFLSNTQDAAYLKTAQPQKDFVELVRGLVGEYKRITNP
jgi:N-acetylmuramoyl-L-alanine amidase